MATGAATSSACPGSQWRYSSGGVSNWVNLASDPTPLSQLRFGDFDGDGRTDVFSISGGQWRYSSGGVSGWIVLTPAGSTPTVTATATATPTVAPTVTATHTPIPPAQGAIADLRFGDFDGDGRTDVFRSQGGQWQFSSAGVGPWQNLAYDPLPLIDLRFGDPYWDYFLDFNADGRTDVFSVSGTQWRYSNGGASNWIALATDSTPLSELRFGDFDGDGRTDVFSTLGGQWRYSSGGTSNWIALASDSRPIQELRFGDFNGDGRTDVFSVSGTQWQYSSAGVSNWIPLASDPTPLQELRFGDFDGDGRTDVFSVASDGRWRYSPGGASNWVPLAIDPTPLNQLRFGDFNGDGRTDVFSIGPDGRWRYSSGGASNWILLGPPDAIASPTPTGWPTTWPPPNTTTPPPSGNCVNIAVNGGMESNDGWMFGDSPVPAAYSSAQWRSGMRSMQMGILPDGGAWTPNSYSSVRQPITIPSGATTAQLRWWHLYYSQEPPTENPGNQSDRQEVILLTPGGKTLKILHRVRRNDGDVAAGVRRPIGSRRTDVLYLLQHL